jgi:hypothetical protein
MLSAPAAAAIADPQIAALARIVPFDEVDIRDMLAFLIATIVETGSALGLYLHGDGQPVGAESIRISGACGDQSPTRTEAGNTETTDANKSSKACNRCRNALDAC